ncbi:hypothetical protein PIROE2DRAFT_13611 [Piromyces sp. E2]|nr:hypothetical protein PIROE2DRAFT_13611 [Piromyces sp. E2]|eukprot:OUM60592.1 hypothetical protein PIROE2DRAFT_13611 [Piromyces sp. E2]
MWILHSITICYIDVIRFLLVDASFIFSWAELIIYVIAIYKYGGNYWYRISNQSFQLTYDNSNHSNPQENIEVGEEGEENNQEYQPEEVHIDIDEEENSTTINNSFSFNRSGILQSSESALYSNKKHITIDSNYQFRSLSAANTFGERNNNLINQLPYNYAETSNITRISETKPIKINHRVSKSIDIKRKKKDSDLYIPEPKGEQYSTIKYNTLPNHLSLKSYSPLSLFFDDNQFPTKSKQSKSTSKTDISNIEKEKKKDKGKGKYIDNELPIAMFENFKKKDVNKNERIQSIISEIELFYDEEIKDLIWGNGIEEAEERIRSDENFREKPHLLMSLVDIYLIKFLINGIIDFTYFIKLLKTAEKSVLDLLTKKSQKLYSKSYSISSLYNTHNSDSLPVSENTSLSSIFSNATSFTNLEDYDNDDDNGNLNDSKSSAQKSKLNYEYLFFKNCEIFYAEIVLIRGYIETIIGKEIRGVM